MCRRYRRQCDDVLCAITLSSEKGRAALLCASNRTSRGKPNRINYIVTAQRFSSMRPEEIRAMRKHIFCAFAACALVPFVCAAQDWPNKPLRFIVPFAAGGSTDQVARILGERLSATLGQQVIIDNRGGGNGVLGTALAAQSSPDGYNYLVVFDVATPPIEPAKNLPYNTVKDFAPITLIASSPMALVVHAASPYQNLAELIAAAKAKPGELILGSGGIGNRGHLAVARIQTGRLQGHASPLPRHIADHHRFARAADNDANGHRAFRRALCEGPAPARACRDRRDTRRAVARSADRRRAGLPRLRRQFMVGHAGARRRAQTGASAVEREIEGRSMRAPSCATVSRKSA